MTYEMIVTRTEGPDSRQVGIVTLNRPKQLNALNDPVSYTHLTLPTIYSV